MSQTSQDCVFCGIVRGSVPSYTIAENRNVIAFLDAFPTTRGHTLVIPKMHVEHFDALDTDIAGEVMRMVQAIAPRIQRALQAAAYNIIVNTGNAAGQVVPHVHIHVIPRYPDDGHRAWPGKKVEQADLAATADLLKKMMRH